MPVNITPEKIKEIARELDCGMKCFYHIASGEIESYPDELKGYAGFDEKLWQDTIDKIENNYRQYISFEELESHESFRMMETFIANIDDDKTRRYFEEAIGRRKPFQ
jgi:predicted regulator of amino acid metabolism with ACT domain